MRSNQILRFRPLAKSHLPSRARTGGGEIPFPFNSDQVTYWHRCQTAIWQGLKQLNLRPGARVLAPAYHCGSEVDALFKAGLTVEYYRSKKDLSPDFDHLEELCKEPADAVYVIHFFGFPQPLDRIRALAAQHNLRLIEDNALGLYSADLDGTPLGKSGDMGVFSLWKSLPVLLGGALYMDARYGNPGADVATKPPARLWADLLLAGIAKEVLYRVPHKLRRSLSRTGSEVPIPPEFPIEIGNWAMFKGNERRLRNFDHEYTYLQRRINYLALDKIMCNLRDIRPVFDRLPERTCPLFFPVWTDDPDGLTDYLYSRGGWCAPPWRGSHPTLAVEDFPQEMQLRRNLLSFPVHQDLNNGDMQFLCDLLHGWSSRQK